MVRSTVDSYINFNIAIKILLTKKYYFTLQRTVFKTDDNLFKFENKASYQIHIAIPNKKN